ncbi:MAG: dipeptidase [Acutalibacteraceae bacterium]
MRLFDLHCDTASKCFDNGFDLLNNNCSVSVSRLKRFDNIIQTYAVFIPENSADPYGYACKVIGFINSFNNKGVKLLNNFKESEFSLKNDRVAGIISIENAICIKDSLDVIDALADMGVLMLSLSWNGANHLAGGKDTSKGLTDFGKKAVKRCEEKNIVIDASHLSDKSFEDLLKCSERPVVASHSNCRSICGNKRNLTDFQIKEIIKRHGLIGINFYPLFLNGGEKAGFDDVLKHIRHIFMLGGENCVSIGSDFDGCKTAQALSETQDCEKLYQYMIDNGVDRATADKIFFKNAFEFFKSCRE